MEGRVGRIAEAWGDEARAAALAARRRKASRFGVRITNWPEGEYGSRLTARDANGRLVGTLHLTHGTREYPDGDYDHEVKIESLEVHPDVRRRGIGTALMAEAGKLWPTSVVDHGGFTEEGAKFHEGRTGEKVQVTQRFERQRRPEEWWEGAGYETPPKLVPYKEKKK